MTAPLIPANVDLRGLEYMPLFGNHLFGSEFNAAATDSEWRAAMTLWWAAWNQVPAGSLPDDDVALCRLADLGRDVKAFRKLKARALHGFQHCDDGRFYHAFLCEQAVVAWEKRVKERERKAKWRADQDAKRAGQDAPVDGDKDGDKTARSASGPRQSIRDVPAEGTGRDVTGRDDKEKEKETTAPAVLVALAGDTYRVPDCPYAEILKAYHEKLPMLPGVVVFNTARRASVRARWVEVCSAEKFDAEQGGNWFRDFFASVARSAFLTGRGKGGWKADLEWLMGPKNFAKAVEGRYDQERA